MKYVIVVPVKNESRFIEKTIQSITRQTIKPLFCLFIDDMSTDSTAAIIQNYSRQFSYMKYQTNTANSSQDEYQLGGHIVRLLLKGKRIIDSYHIDYDYLVKLDGDIQFDATFIESIWQKIKGDNYGIVSGTPYSIRKQKKIYNDSPPWHSRGQFKIYNKDCIEQIGGPPTMLGWDCADNIRAIEFGWKTKVFQVPEYRMSRAIGGKFSLARGRVNHGIGAYQLGYHPIYFILRTLYNMFEPPYFIGSCYMLYGYVNSVFTSDKKSLTSKQVKILRRLHWRHFRKKVTYQLERPISVVKEVSLNKLQNT